MELHAWSKLHGAQKSRTLTHELRMVKQGALLVAIALLLALIGCDVLLLLVPPLAHAGLLGLADAVGVASAVLAVSPGSG